MADKKLGFKTYGVNSGNDFRIQLQGFEETLRALRKMNPDAAKALLSSMRQASGLVRQDARKSVNSLSIPSGWRNQQGMPTKAGSWANRELTRNGRGWPPWQKSNIKSGIKAYMRRQKNRGNVVQARGIVVSRSGEGVIYEFAQHSHKSVQYPWVNSEPFLRKLGQFQGGRIIWAAAERNRNKVQTLVMDALEKANQALQAGLEHKESR